MYWFIAAVGFIVLEMMLGTFYLLVMSAILASVGLTQWLFDTPLSVNLALFAVFNVIGIPLARHFQKKRANRPRSRANNQPLDIGQSVLIEKHLHHNLYQVKYRGTTWQAQLDDSSALSGQTAYIHARQGNVLHIQTQPPSSSL